MDRFLSPKGSSSAASSCSAAQPALPPVSSANILAAHHGCPVDSGGEDGRGMTLEVKIGCVRDVQRWLALKGSSSAASSCSAAQPALPPALHSLDREVREAIAVLTRAPRPKKEDVEPLLGKWRVQQKRQGKKRPLAETIKDLEDKVIRAAQKLQAELANKPETILAVSAAQPAATFVSCAAQPVPAGPSIEFPSHSPSIVIENHGRTADSRGDDGATEKLEAKIECVRDVQHWLATVNVSSGNPEVGSVREAVAVLTRGLRLKAEDIQPFFFQYV